MPWYACLGKNVNKNKDARGTPKQFVVLMGDRDGKKNILTELGNLFGEYVELGMKTLGALHTFSPKLIEFLAGIGVLTIFLLVCLAVLCVKCGIWYLLSCFHFSMFPQPGQGLSSCSKQWACCPKRTRPQPHGQPLELRSSLSLPLNQHPEETEP